MMNILKIIRYAIIVSIAICCLVGLRNNRIAINKLIEVNNKIKTFDFYIDPNNTTSSVFQLPEGTRLVSVNDLRNYYKYEETKDND